MRRDMQKARGDVSLLLFYQSNQGDETIKYG